MPTSTLAPQFRLCQEVHLLTPTPCEYITLHDNKVYKKDFAEIKDMIDEYGPWGEEIIIDFPGGHILTTGIF